MEKDKSDRSEKSVKVKGKAVKDKDLKSTVKDKNPKGDKDAKDKVDPKDVKEKGKDAKLKRGNQSARTNDEKSSRKSQNNSDQMEGNKKESVDHSHRHSHGSHSQEQEHSGGQKHHNVHNVRMTSPQPPPEPEIPPEIIPVKPVTATPSRNTLFIATNRETEKNIAEDVEDFWTTAWAICSERFQQGNGPISVSLELRDTWLRVMEVQWMDHDLSIGKRQVLPSKVFTPDDPPLPLQYDSWSRGGLQEMPQSSDRKESILDPFLRDKKTASTTSSPKLLTPPPTVMKGPSPPPQQKWNQFFFSKWDPNERPVIKPFVNSKPITAISATTSAKSAASKLKSKLKSRPHSASSKSSNLKSKLTIRVVGSGDHLELRSASSVTLENLTDIGDEDTDYYESDYVPTIEDKLDYIYDQVETPPRISDPSVHGPENIPLPLPSVQEFSKSWELLLKPKMLPSKSSMDVNQAYKRLGVKPWSPSDCGGRKGSGVFRLPNESTTEVIRRTYPDYVPKNKGNNIAQSTSRAVESSGVGLKIHISKPVVSISERIVDPDDFSESMVDILNYSEAREFTNLLPSSDVNLMEEELPSTTVVQSPNRTPIQKSVPIRALSNPQTSISNYNDNDGDDEGPSEYKIHRSPSLPIPMNNTRPLTNEEKAFVNQKVQAFNAKLLRQQQLKVHQLAKKEESLSQARQQNPQTTLVPTPDKGDKLKLKLGAKGGKLQRSVDTAEIDKKMQTLKRHSLFAKHGVHQVQNPTHEDSEVHMAGLKVTVELHMKDAETMEVT